MKTSRIVIALIATFGVLALSSCGGGGGGGGTNPPPPPPASTLEIVLSVVTDGEVGKPYSLQLNSRGGSGSVTWSIVTNTTTWAVIDSTGKITGTPDAPGNYYLEVRAQSGTQSTSNGFVIWVSAPLQFTLTPADAIRSYPYYWLGMPEGGKYPFTATLVSGSLPSGVTLSPQGGSGVILSGTPDTLGTYTFTVRIKDSATTPQSIDVPLTLKVLKILKITTESLKYGIVGRPYSDTLQTINGTPPLNWSADELPTNMSIDATTGTVSGTPAETHYRDYRFVVKDSDSPQQSDAKWVRFIIYDVLRVPSPSLTITAHLHDSVYEVLSSTGGVLPITVTPSSSALVPGLSYENQVLVGTPTTTGTWSGTLHYADSAEPPQTVDRAITINVLPPLPLILNSPETPLVNEPYSYQMLASRGTAPYKWSVASGMLPAGISLSQGGLLSGSTATGGIYNFTLKVTDSASPAQSSTVGVTFSILPKALGRNDTVPTATTLTSGVATLSPYDDPPGTAAPDTDYYKLYAVEGAEVTIQVRKANPGSPLDPLLEIVDANGIRYQTCNDPADDLPSVPIVVDTTPNGFDDECLNDDISVGDDTDSKLVFKVPGDTGKVVNFYAHVLDLQGNARPDMSYLFDYWGGLSPLVILTGPNIEMTQGANISYPLNASGGSGTLTWSVNSGSLPPGISFSTGGVLSGAPSSTGYFVFAVKVSDSSNPAMTATKTFGVTVVPQ